jgi:hypothetical protein
MKRVINRFHITTLFILASIPLFYILKIPFDTLYSTRVNDRNQFTLWFEIGTIFLGVYVAVLWLISLGGYFYFRLKSRTELAKGFFIPLFIA